jgi:NaMN:DMB phosphoribosyltransferase
MKLAGILLLLAGWAIVLSALALLRSTPALADFVLAGTVIELLGLFLMFRSHVHMSEESR